MARHILSDTELKEIVLWIESKKPSIWWYGKHVETEFNNLQNLLFTLEEQRRLIATLQVTELERIKALIGTHRRDK